MFAAFGKVFSAITRLFNCVDILASTGEEYAKQFQEDAMYELELKRKARQTLTKK